MITLTSMTSGATPATVLQAAGPDWRTCAADLIRWLVRNDRCFSSGEIAQYMRKHRTDVHFSVTALGDLVRDWYYGQELPCYDNGMYPAMVPRTTQGLYDTPAGVQVFVYARSRAEGLSHDFEVLVPLPANVRSRLPEPAQTLRRPAEDLTAHIRSDRWCVVPRAALECYVHMAGRTVRNGDDQVHITFDSRSATITLDPTPTSTPYHLWSGRGRIAFAAPSGRAPFVPGSRMPIEVSPAGLTVVLP